MKDFRIVVLLSFVVLSVVTTLVHSSPAFNQLRQEWRSKREAPTPEPESSSASSSPATDSSTPGAEPESEVEPNSNSTTNGTEGAMKDKKGFFQNLGDNIKKGANSAAEKIKSTAENAKESVRKAVNNAAKKVKEATEIDPTTSTLNPECKDSDVNCTMSTTEAAPASRRRRHSGSDKHDHGLANNKQSDSVNGSDQGMPNTAMPESSTMSSDSDSSAHFAGSSPGLRFPTFGISVGEVSNNSRTGISALEHVENSRDPVLVNGPEGSLISNQGAPGTEENTTVKDFTIPTEPPIGPNPTLKKPGKCPPLAPGLQCVALGNDAAQCRSDSACPGTKKCCFFACQPYNAVGVCETPVFYPSTAKKM